MAAGVGCMEYMAACEGCMEYMAVGAGFMEYMAAGVGCMEYIWILSLGRFRLGYFYIFIFHYVEIN